MKNTIKSVLKTAKWVEAKRINIGQTMEVGNVRYHRYSDHLVVYDLTNAGKRGKKVRKFSAGGYDHDKNEAQYNEIFNKITENSDYDKALKTAKAFERFTKNIMYSIDEMEYRGVDIRPSETSEKGKKYLIKGRDFKLESTIKTFSVHQLGNRGSEQALIPPVYKAKKTNITKFYKFVQQYEEKIKSMDFNQLSMALDKEKIEYHQYSTWD